MSGLLAAFVFASGGALCGPWGGRDQPGGIALPPGRESAATATLGRPTGRAWISGRYS